MKNTVYSSNEANIDVFNHTGLIKVHQNNFSSFKHSYQIVKKRKKNTDPDNKNNTEVSVFQYVFEEVSVSVFYIRILSIN